MRIRLLLALCLVLPTVALVPGAPPAHAACAAPSTKFISGTVLGSDYRALNVQISFDVVDKYNRRLAMDGCLKATGYTKYFLFNRLMSSEGEPRSSSNQWKFRLSNLPANAARVYIETYPRSPGNPDCSTCAGKEVWTRYGRGMRRAVAVNSSGVNVRLPLICGRGGTTGKIVGKITDRSKNPVSPDSLYMWSEAPDNNTANPIMGWGARAAKETGSFTSTPLASGQKYTLIATRGSKTYKLTGVPVSSCKSTPVWVWL